MPACHIRGRRTLTAIARASASLLLMGSASTLWAQDASNTPAAFELGTVTVKGSPVSTESVSENKVNAQTLREQDLDTVSQAAITLPGVSLSKNSRNEDMLSVRGFDPRQVPVFVDGIPLYVPYDGYVDFARFTTFDLAEIRVAKGAASLMYGPNTLGGAINLVTRKPTRPFEGDAQLGVSEGAGHKAALNLGGNQGLWYYQLGVSYLSANGFPLPKGFTDRKKTPTDTGDYRRNADYSDKRLSFKVGLTPNATDEYAIGYVRQEGAKGNPAYTGALTGGQANRRWRWPYWDKDSLYFIGNKKLGESHIVKARLYYDRYKNGLDSYTDASYTTPITSTSFPSYYNDKTIGGSLELASYAFAQHELRASVSYKQDRHKDSNPLSDTKNYKDVTTSFALEDTYSFAQDWQLRAGVSHDKRDAKQVYGWPTGSTSANNWLAELSHQLNPDLQAYGSVARKTRFPTIKDRYSGRMGENLPSPDLKPENATHFELGLRGQPWRGGSAQAAVFYSRIKDLIQEQTISSDQCGGTTCDQYQNIGKARHSGFELSLDQAISPAWQAGVSYTYLQRRNLSDRSVQLTDTPRHRLYAHTRWQVAEQWALQATLDAEQGRKVSYSTGYRQLGGYALWGMKAIWQPRKDVTVDAGVRNIGDKYFELSEGYPMPGRTLYANLLYRF